MNPRLLETLGGKLELSSNINRNADSAISAYFDRITGAISSVNPAEITDLAKFLLKTRTQGGKVLIAGNGGSSSTASHYAIDWMFGSRLNNPPIAVINLAESSSNLSATGNDVDFEDVFARNIRSLGRKGDLLVLVSASGNSPNLVRAVSAGREAEMTIVAVTGFDGGVLRGLADSSVHCPTVVGDYGVAEDLHLMLGHIVKELLLSQERD